MANLTQQVANTVSTIGVKSSYGEVVEVDGTTILPVAASWYGFGVGEGEGDTAAGGSSKGEGAGAGGGGASLPVGAYVTQNGHTRFEPNTVALLAVSIPLVWVAGRAIARIFRAFRGKR